MSWSKVEETLSDGSTVFNVSSEGMDTIHAINEAAAIEIEECLNKNSTD